MAHNRDDSGDDMPYPRCCDDSDDSEQGDETSVKAEAEDFDTVTDEMARWKVTHMFHFMCSCDPPSSVLFIFVQDLFISIIILLPTGTGVRKDQ